MDYKSAWSYIGVVLSCESVRFPYKQYTFMQVATRSEQPDAIELGRFADNDNWMSHVKSRFDSQTPDQDTPPDSKNSDGESSPLLQPEINESNLPRGKSGVSTYSIHNKINCLENKAVYGIVPPTNT